jgi:hypothetical protein
MLYYKIYSETTLQTCSIYALIISSISLVSEGETTTPLVSQTATLVTTKIPTKIMLLELTPLVSDSR